MRWCAQKSCLFAVWQLSRVAVIVRETKEVKAIIILFHPVTCWIRRCLWTFVCCLAFLFRCYNSTCHQYQTLVCHGLPRQSVCSFNCQIVWYLRLAEATRATHPENSHLLLYIFPHPAVLFVLASEHVTDSAPQIYRNKSVQLCSCCQVAFSENEWIITRLETKACLLTIFPTGSSLCLLLPGTPIAATKS